MKDHNFTSPNISSFEFTLFKKLLSSECGIDISEHKRKTFHQALGRRLSATGLGRPAEYYYHITKNDPDRGEIQSLINEITINETYFFRHPLHFETMKKIILPELLTRNNKLEPIRIWSAGCSTGEEAYSLAIICHELGLSSRNSVEIWSTDIDNQAIRTAKEAIYYQRSFRGNTPEMIDTYFKPCGKGYKLNEHIKKIPNFHLHNLLNKFHSPFEDSMIDVIFCRNVLIYFQNDVIEQILAKFYEILNPGGTLFLGGTETLNLYQHSFSDVLLQKTFYYKKGGAQQFQFGADLPDEFGSFESESEQPAYDTSPFDSQYSEEYTAGDGLGFQFDNQVEPEVEEQPQKPKKRKAEQTRELFEKAKEAFRYEDFNEAKEIIESVLEQDSQFPGAKALLCEITMNLGEYSRTVALSKELLAEDQLNSEAHYILGCILKKQEDNEGALEYFRHAIYLDPNFAMSHFSLANIFRDQGDLKNARRSYHNTIHSLQKSSGNVIKFASGFPREILIRTCERNIEQLNNEIT
ncbi:CheR family methyltransferase [candidate division CSSED10-310 bacterium]|uniref:protein-glutamate O-methyltransferase n=1 Tax=candidate division CSSED10-310 bacterium TaxID=2855610 RepID=A0ABV6Z4X6_UNCC1